MQTKICTVCKEIKPTEFFHRCSRSKSGLQHKCRECAKIVGKKRYQNKKEQILLKNAMWRDNNKTRHKDSQKRWKENNVDKVNYMTSLRRARRKNATPLWADEERIKHIYAHCHWLNKTFGCNMHVDHVIPLSGKNVCGLHVHTNLQIISAEENMKKSNSFLGDI